MTGKQMTKPDTTVITIDQVLMRAVEKGIDPTGLEKLIELQERVLATEAKRAFAAALTELQGKLPRITRKGIVYQKGSTTKVRNKYSKFEDIMGAIQPDLYAAGFGVSFDTDTENDHLLITCTLSHSGGHSVTSSIVLPLKAEYMNDQQTVGSVTSYGKRYTLKNVLNLVEEDEDNDANIPEELTTEQKKKINALLQKLPPKDRESFFRFAKVKEVSEIHPSAFGSVSIALEKKIEQRAKS